jgi:mRNA interferase MazF
LTRGDIALVVFPGAYGKPRPSVIVQADFMNRVHGSIVVVPLTTYQLVIEGIRVRIEPSASTGLREFSFVMVDKITVVPREKVRAIVGRVDAAALQEIGRCLMNILDLP